MEIEKYKSNEYKLNSLQKVTSECLQFSFVIYIYRAMKIKEK